MTKACKIGELNGGWAVLLKLALILLPLQMMFQAWCVLKITDLETNQAKIVTFISLVHGPHPKTN